MAAPPDDLRQGGVDGAVHAHQVDVDDAFEVLRGHRTEGRDAGGDPSVGDDDVEPAEALDRHRDGTLNGGAVGHVRGHAEGACVVYLRGGGLGGGLVEVGDHDARAAPCERVGGREADPAGGARDQRDLA